MVGVGIGPNKSGPAVASIVLGGWVAGGGGGSSPWTPLNDPNLVAWYQADSYRSDTVSGYPRIVPQDKLNNTANRELVHITAPTGANDLLQLDDTTYPFPVFVTHGKGVKTTDVFRFADFDIYLVAKILTPGGNTSRYVDHDYGNGLWMGTGASSALRIAGVRQGGSPYGYGGTPPDPGTNGWFLMQLSRSSILEDDYQIQFGSDDQNYKVAGNGSSGLTNSNGLAVGSDLGGNSGVPSMHVAAILVYRRFKGSHPDTGRPLDRELRRQAWIAHAFPSIKDNIISTLDHPYYASPPTVEATLTQPGTAKYDWDSETGVFSDNGTTPITNGTSVYRINDQSGNNAHLLQATSGNRGAFRGANVLHYGLNGRPVVQFDGSNDYMEASINLTASTSLAVAWAMASGAFMNKGLFQITDTVGAGTNAIYVRTSDTLQQETIDVYVDGNYRFNAKVSKSQVMMTWVLHWSGTVWTLFCDGIELGTYTGGFSNASVATKIFLAAGFSGHGNSDSLFGKLAIFDNVAGVPDPQLLANYLAQRWG